MAVGTFKTPITPDYRPQTWIEMFQGRVIADGGTFENYAETLSFFEENTALINDASLVLTPNGYKAGKAHSFKAFDGTGDFTCTRNSGATRVNSASLIENVLANVPRLNYVNGVASWLLEPQRTNLLTYSEQFDDASWGKFFSGFGIAPVVTSNYAISPDGTMNASRVIFNMVGTSVNDQSYLSKFISAVVGNGTGSVWLKSNTGLNQEIFIRSGSIFSGITQKVIVTNNWQKFSETQLNADRLWVGIRGTVTNNLIADILIYGAQIEAGAFPTSYIPTVASAVPRVADTFSRNNIFTNGLISASGGTWFVELENNLSLVRDAFGSGLWVGDNANNSTAGNSLHIRNGGNGRLSINKTVLSSGTELYRTLTDKVKLAITWNGTTANIFVNGVKVVTDTPFTTTNMEFLNGSGADVPKYIKQMWLKSTPTNDAKLIAATTL